MNAPSPTRSPTRTLETGARRLVRPAARCRVRRVDSDPKRLKDVGASVFAVLDDHAER
jgi:hypothetical protein